MSNYLPFLLVVTLWIYAFVDCVTTPQERVRGLPKVAWVLIVLLFGEVMVGPLAWLLLGKRHGTAVAGRQADWQREYRELREQRQPRDGHRREQAPAAVDPSTEPGWVPPDDNPEFLRTLSELNKQRRGDGTASPEGE